jgi:hypothetical protein
MDSVDPFKATSYGADVSAGLARPTDRRNRTRGTSASPENEEYSLLRLQPMLLALLLSIRLSLGCGEWCRSSFQRDFVILLNVLYLCTCPTHDVEKTRHPRCPGC